MLGIQVMGTRMIRSRWAPLIRLKMPLRRLLQAVLLGEPSRKSPARCRKHVGNTKWTQKVIVLLTDGVPTFSYQVSKVQTETNGSYYGTQFTNRQDQPGSTSRISNSYYAPDQKKYQ